MENKYDVAIIGAGIGGLVCGCHLVKAGLKVLVVEKNPTVGGYCKTLRKGRFNFDVCAHSLGSCRKDGDITKMMCALGIEKRLNIIRYTPSDIIITPDCKISFYNDLNMTIQELKKNFPKEKKNIEVFFKSLIAPSYIALRKKTFEDLLNIFENNVLKGILSFPLWGNAGLPPSRISAFFSCLMYKEFLIDGGYYPEGGMQMLPDILTQRFKQLGGDLLLSHNVIGISVKDNKVEGITIEKTGRISAQYVISDCDPIQTFFKLIGKENIDKKSTEELLSMEPSLSMFILYLGLDNNYNIPFPKGSNVWYLPHNDIEKLYLSAKNRKAENIEEYMFHVQPETNALSIFINAYFGNKTFWKNNKNTLAETLLKKVESTLLLNLSKNIKYKGVATPQTLYDWTSNHKGAAYGWAALPSQLLLSEFIRKTFIQNLYIASQWSTFGSGIRGTVYSGAYIANLILNKIK